MGKTQTWMNYNASGILTWSGARYHECPFCGAVFDAVWELGKPWHYCPMCGEKLEIDESLEE